MTQLSEGIEVGPYKIVRMLGKGGMGAVFEAVHSAIERRVAIKVLHADYAADGEFTERFFNEARAVNIVDHPGLVQISDYGRLPDGTAYIVMEFLKGETLGQRLKRAQYGMPIAEVVHLSWQVADSLAAAHEKGIVHRDLKPDNIMIVPDRHMPSGERTKLLDFGIAKVNDAAGSASAKTQVGALMGTPAYMSPEQCAGAGGADAKSDVYSLGCVIYQMLAGHVPFVGEGAGEVMGMQQFVEPQPLAKVAPATPVPLAVLVQRLLAKQRTARPSMQEAAADLDVLCTQYPIKGRRPGIQNSSSGRLSSGADAHAATVSPSGASRPSGRSSLSQAAAESRHQVGRKRLGLAIGAALLGVAALSVVLLLSRRPAPIPTPSPAAQIATPASQQPAHPTQPTSRAPSPPPAPMPAPSSTASAPLPTATEPPPAKATPTADPVSTPMRSEPAYRHSTPKAKPKPKHETSNVKPAPRPPIED